MLNQPQSSETDASGGYKGREAQSFYKAKRFGSLKKILPATGVGRWGTYSSTGRDIFQTFCVSTELRGHPLRACGSGFCLFLGFDLKSMIIVG